MKGPQLISTLTCPACGSQEIREMPLDACVYFHPCSTCGTTSKPRAGDCCVFCSYGDTPCPSMQSPT
ncbi:MAG TPA: GDCCVxC domain-containing (seleno)protein [Arthrobacter sp.]|jgi:hypothetical protein